MLLIGMKFARKTSLFMRYIAKIVAECYFILTIKIPIARMRYQKFNKHLRNVEFHLHWASKLLFWVMMNVSIVSRMWENTSTIELTDESARAKSDFPRLRPLQHFPRTLSNVCGFFIFPRIDRRAADARGGAFLCNMLHFTPFSRECLCKMPKIIFPKPLDNSRSLWYNIIVVKRGKETDRWRFTWIWTALSQTSTV